jgi:hypothetical protein
MGRVLGFDLLLFALSSGIIGSKVFLFGIPLAANFCPLYPSIFELAGYNC